MKIEMSFEFGDKLYWVNLLNADVDAKTILAEIRDDGGIINGVYLSDDGHVEGGEHEKQMSQRLLPCGFQGVQNCHQKLRRRMGAGEGCLLHADGFYLHGQLLAALPGEIAG